MRAMPAELRAPTRRPTTRARRSTAAAPAGSTPTRQAFSEAAGLEHGDAGRARGGAGASPADRARHRAGRAAEVSPRRAATTPTAKAGPCTPRRSASSSACTAIPTAASATCRRRRFAPRRLVVDTGMHALGLEPPAGDRLHGRARRPGRGLRRLRGRPLPVVARPGARLHDRPAEDHRAARPRASRASASASTSAASTWSSSTRARCR